MKNRLVAVVTASLLASLLVACSSTDGTVSKVESPVAEASATENGSPATKEKAPTNPAFGDTYTWDDGLAVAVSEPSEFSPSEYAAGTVEGQSNIIFDVTVTNGTSEDIESSLVNITVSSGGKEASAIFDTEGGTDFVSSTILPGKSLSWKVAYSVADPADVQMTVDNVVDFDRGKVHFTN